MDPEIQERFGALAALQEEIRGRTFTSIKDLVLVTLDDETSKAKAKRDRLKAACQTARDSLEQMQRLMVDYKLGELDVEMVPPFEPLLERLNNVSRDIRLAHDQRLERRRLALETMTALTDDLEEVPPCSLPTGNVAGDGSLSLATICDLESGVEEMQILSRERTKLANALTDEIANLEKKLGIQGAPPVCNRSSSAGSLSRKRLRELQGVRDELKRKVSEREADMAELQMRRSNLRRMLDLEFLPVPDLLGPADFNLVYQDLGDLEKMRLQHMEKFVKKARKELVDIGARLFLRPEEVVLPRDEYTEEVLVEHENAILEFRRALEDPERQKISKYVTEYLRIQDVERELTELMKDPTRYNRRGKEMLSEQKKRDFVTRRKPPVVASLTKLLDQWASTHDKPLLVFGSDIRDDLHGLNDKLNHVRSASRLARPIAPPKLNDSIQNSRHGKVKPQGGNRSLPAVPEASATEIRPKLRKSRAMEAIRTAPAKLKRALNYPGVSKQRKSSSPSKPINAAPTTKSGSQPRQSSYEKENILSPGTAFQEWKRKKVVQTNPNDTYTLGGSFRYSTDGF